MKEIIYEAMMNFIAENFGSSEAEDPCYNMELMADAVEEALRKKPEKPEELDEIIVLGKIEEGRCPYCGSLDNDYEAIRLADDHLAYYPATCTKCHRKFEEWYQLKYVGHNCGDDLNIEAVEGLEIVMKKVD